VLQLWRARPVLVSSFLLACAVTLFFGVRFVSQVIYWSNPAHHNQTVQGWMTVGYIGRSWSLDPHELDALANLPRPETKGRRQPLAEIARERGVPLEQLIAEVEAAIAVMRLGAPTP
jgi:hypothetical protein